MSLGQCTQDQIISFELGQATYAASITKQFLSVSSSYVAECNCGTLHVTFGPVSYALDSEALRRLHELLGAAIQRLDSAPDKLSQPKPILPHFSHLAMRRVMKIKH
jgi:hypothetical protein